MPDHTRTLSPEPRPTYGFILKRSRTATLALASRLRMRSVKSLSLVQVMCTLSAAPSALSLTAACEAVFLSWISWACGGVRGDVRPEQRALSSQLDGRLRTHSLRTH